MSAKTIEHGLSSPVRGWKQTTLGELASNDDSFIQTGPFGSQLHKHDYTDVGVGTVNPTHLERNRINHSNVPRVSPETASRLDRHRLLAGDILFARRGEIGRHGLVSKDEEGWLCGTGCFLVRIRRDDVDNLFLSYSISTPETIDWLERHAAGVVMPNLNNTVLQQLPIQHPPLPEQQKIAEVLGVVQRAMEQQERLLALTAELKKTLLHQLFTQGLRHEPQKQTDIGPVPESWVVVKLGSLLREPLRNGHSARASNDGTGIRTLTLTAVTKRDFCDENTKLTVADPHRVRDMWLRNGDILIERANTPEYVGLSALYEGPEDWSIYSDLMIRVRLDETRAMPYFVSEYLLTDPCRKYYQTHARSSAGNFPKIDQGTIEKTLIPLPSPDEQNEIAAGLRAADSKLSCHQRKHATLTALFRTLLHQLMTAQIRVGNA